MPITNRVARLVLVDDHDMVRASLRDMLVDEPSVEVVGEATNGREAIALCARIWPDLVLMDIRMPEMDGIEATQRIKRNQPNISVLMLTMHADPDYLLEALKAGVAGYVLKEADPDQLVSAVQRVLSGDSPLDPDLAARLLKRLAHEVQGKSAPLSEPAKHASENNRPPAPPITPLTPRELEVLNLVAQGHTNPKIAQALVISAGTVKRHVENIIAKLEVSDRTQAAVRAYELKLVTSSGR